jgi:hypothetical protein
MTLSSRKMRSQRVLEITSVADVSANTYVVSAVKFYRDGIDGEGETIAFEQNSSNPDYIELGEAIPSPTIIKLIGTIQA